MPRNVVFDESLFPYQKLFSTNIKHGPPPLSSELVPITPIILVKPSTLHNLCHPSPTQRRHTSSIISYPFTPPSTTNSVGSSSSTPIQTTTNYIILISVIEIQLPINPSLLSSTSLPNNNHLMHTRTKLGIVKSKIDAAAITLKLDLVHVSPQIVA